MLSRDQRQRVLHALAEIVSKRGYQAATVELIVKRAGVSRATFYEHFENREDCLLAALAETSSAIERRVRTAAAEQSDWPAAMRAGLAAFLEFVVENPEMTRTCLVESVSAGRLASERYEQALRRFVPAFAPGRRLASTAQLPDTLEDSLIGGVVWMVHQRLLRGEIEQVAGLLPTMLEFVLAPYLGAERAARIAADG